MTEGKSVSIQFPLVDEDTWISDSTTRTQIPAKGVIVFTYKDTNEGRKIGLRVGDGYNYLGNLPLIDGNDEELAETVKQIQEQLNDLSSNINKITVFRLRGVFSSLEDVAGPVSGDVVLIISNKITSDAYNSAEEFLYYNEKWERIGSINDWSRVSKLEASLKELEDTVNSLSAKQLTMNASLTTLSGRLDTEIAEEKNARIAADETTDAALNAEISARQNGDNALQQSLQQEVSTLTNTLNEQVDNLTSLIQTEEINRQEADNLITNSLTEETAERKAKDELLQNNISAEVKARTEAISDLSKTIFEKTTALIEKDREHDEQINTLQTDVATVETKLFNTHINTNNIGNERYLTTNEKMITLIGTSETGENSLRLGQQRIGEQVIGGSAWLRASKGDLVSGVKVEPSFLTIEGPLVQIGELEEEKTGTGVKINQQGQIYLRAKDEENISDHVIQPASTTIHTPVLTAMVEERAHIRVPNLILETPAVANVLAKRLEFSGIDDDYSIVLPQKTYIHNLINGEYIVEENKIATKGELPTLASNNYPGLVRGITVPERENLGIVYSVEAGNAWVYPDFTLPSGTELSINLISEEQDADGNPLPFTEITDFKFNIIFVSASDSSITTKLNFTYAANLVALPTTAEEWKIQKVEYISVYPPRTSDYWDIKVELIRKNTNFKAVFNKVKVEDDGSMTVISTDGNTVYFGDISLQNTLNNKYRDLENQIVEYSNSALEQAKDYCQDNFLPLGLTTDTSDKQTYYGFKNYVDEKMTTAGITAKDLENYQQNTNIRFQSSTSFEVITDYLKLSGGPSGAEFSGDNVYIQGDRVYIKTWDSSKRLTIDYDGYFLNKDGVEENIATEEWVEKYLKEKGLISE